MYDYIPKLLPIYIAFSMCDDVNNFFHSVDRLDDGIYQQILTLLIVEFALSKVALFLEPKLH